MKIALMDPSGFKPLLNNKQVMPNIMPNIGLAYIASILKQKHDVRILDVSFSSKAEIAQFLNWEPNFYGFTVSSYNYLDAVCLIQTYRLKQKARIFAGGHHVSIVKEEIFKDGVWDFAFLGEAEKTVHSYFNEGIQNPAGTIAPGSTQTEAPSRIADLDLFPFPEFGAFVKYNYEYHPLITSRGCPFSCSFCASSALWGKKWFARNPKNVVEEILWVKKNFGDRIFHVNDDNLTLIREHAEGFCEGLLKKGKPIRWIAQGVRADRVDKKLLRLLKKAGCIRFSIGVESASETVLKNIGKKETLAQIKQCLKDARAIGLDCLAMFMIGNEGDTSKTLQETFEFIKREQIYPFDFYMLLPYPGTPIWEKTKHLIKEDYRTFDHYSNKPVFSTPEFSQEERIAAKEESEKLKKEMDRRTFIKKHLLFFLPPNLFYHSLEEIKKELAFLYSKRKGFVKKLKKAVSDLLITA